MSRRLALLVLSVFLFWLVSAYPVFRIWGEQVLLYTGVAAWLCLAPTALTFAWGYWVQRQAPHQQMIMVLGGTGLRLAVVLGAGLLLYRLDYFERQSFLVCLVVYYLVSLFAETVVMVAGRSHST